MCELACGKKLQCGVHTCQETCHGEHCQPCWEYSKSLHAVLFSVFLRLIMVASVVWLFGKDRFVLMVKVVSMVCIVSNLQIMKSLPVIVVLRLSIPLSLVAPALLPAPTPVPGCTPAHILSITTAIVISSVPSVPFSP